VFIARRNIIPIRIIQNHLTAVKQPGDLSLYKHHTELKNFFELKETEFETFLI